MRKVKKAVAKAAVARKKAAAKKKARAARKAAAIPKAASSALPSGDAKAAPHPALREEFTIEARNFGPVKEAKLTLKPLTVLIGPSNTGKTYMAMLACMMMKKHTSFSQAARMNMRFYPDPATLASFSETTLKKMGEDELRSVADELALAIENGGNFVLLSALPEKFRNLWRDLAAVEFSGHKIGRKTRGGIWDNVESDLAEYYGVGNLINLVAGSGRGAFSCEYVARVDGVETSRARIEWSRASGVSVASEMSDFCFPVFLSKLSDNLDEIKNSLSADFSMFRKHGARMIDRALGMLLDSRAADPSAHFLPASRGGVTQAQRVMGIAMMRIGSRAGLTKIPYIPTLSKPIVDYLEDIGFLLERLRDKQEGIRGVRGLSRARRMRWMQSNVPGNIHATAERIEELLGGQIVAKNYGGNGGASAMMPPPTLAYRPDGLEVELEMAQSSSMVGEIAPLTLYLKGGIGPGYTLFIEEPEAHLHPAAQTKMAEILAAMVRAGIRVVITTHSDWMLDALAHLVREEKVNSKDGDSSLKEDDVGVYWFEPGKAGAGSKATPLQFDNDHGYLPRDVRAESTALYNKTVPLQTKLDEMLDQ